MMQSDIMIVDDNPANLKLLEDMLLQRGYHVRSFSLARLALASATKKPPGLILVDINMLEMNGYEMCERLKATKSLSEIPVIFLCALHDTHNKVKVFHSGAVDYVSKPFQLEEIHARVETHLRLYHLQRALKLSYERLEESAVDIIFRYELFPKRRVAYINPVAKSIVGYSPDEYYADPELILKIIHPTDRHLMETLLSDGSGSTDGMMTFRCIHRNSKAVWIEQHNRLVRDSEGRLVAIEGIARDVSERKHLEAQLRQSQKMESMGLLAGGVAHDFNNLLTVIIGYSDFILVEDKPPAAIVEKLSEVRKAAEQAATLTRQLLAFGRTQLVQFKALDINAVVQSSLKMLRRVIGENIEFITDLEPKLTPIKADAAQIEQVLMNLAVNAKGAMRQGGKITIETKNVLVEETNVASPLEGKTGPHAMLTVSDNGCGMDASTLTRIFEPFFTTKEQGKGTGLGLSIVYGIVEQSNGHIRVSSEPGKGARFEILFPKVEASAEATDTAAAPTAQPTGSETILVVEDDVGVRQLISAVLRKGGYEVLIASEGSEALKICEQYQGKIGLILTDVIMPGMSGATLVEALKKLNTYVRILFMSGYTGDTVTSQGEIDPGIPFIQKPFTSASLLGKIREVLSGTIALNASGNS